MSPRASPTSRRHLPGAGDPVAMATGGVDRTPVTLRAPGAGLRVPQKAPAGTEANSWDEAAWRAWNSRWNGWSNWQCGNGSRIGLRWSCCHPLSKDGTTGRCWTRPRREEPGDDGSGRTLPEWRKSCATSSLRRKSDGETMVDAAFKGSLETSARSQKRTSRSRRAPPELMDEGMTAEGGALVVDAKPQAQEAITTLHQARRTLRDARQRQQQAKQSRKYYTAGAPGRNYSSQWQPMPRAAGILKEWRS